MKFSIRPWWPVLAVSWLGCSSEEAPAPSSPPPEVAPETPIRGAQTGTQRLSVTQYRSSIQDILGQDIVIPTALEPDQAQSGFVAVGASFSTVSARGIEQYEKAAYAIAKQALAPELRDRLVSCKPAGTTDDACARSTLQSLGRKVWRRPLEQGELDALVGISAKAATTLNDFYEGLQYGVAGLLQSPHFLYRASQGEDDPRNPGKRRYTSYEMASRLSFFFWNTTPDDELLDAAQSGVLVDEAGLQQQAERLLASPRAREGARNFFNEYLGLDELKHLSKDPTIFTYYSPEVGPAAREETLRLFEHFVFDLDGDYRDLLTTRVTFVNPKLASMYGIPAPDLGGFGRTEHPEDSPRRGLLGHISILAQQAHPVSSSATLRGKFIRTRLLCGKVPDPPVNANTALPEPSPELPTLRQRVQKHLTDLGCASCHLRMDPIGLGLEQFDGIGRFRRRENEVAIDPSGELDGAKFQNALGLAEAVRNHPDLGPCFVRNLYRYASAFPEVGEDDPAIDALSYEFRASGYKVRSLFLTIALSPSFRLAQEPRLAMPFRPIPRRTLLRGLLGGAAVSLSLPILEAFLNNNGTALASGSPLPKRFGIFFWGNGVLQDGWTPEGNGPDWQPSTILAPLADLRSEITVVSGMKVYTGNTVPHGSGPAGLLSGAALLKEDTDSFAAASIDQVIAGAIGGETRFRSLEVGVQKTERCFSFNAPYSMNPPECSPRALYERLFLDGFVEPGAGPKVDPKLALRRSVLDAVSEDAKRLQQRLGAADKSRLQQHFDGIRALELQLKKLEENPPNLAACKTPADPGEDLPDIDGRPQLAESCRAMGKLLAMALACDQTRVFSLWFSRPVSNLLFPKASAGHHQLTHDEADPQPQVLEILHYILGELNLFLKEFAAIQEGDGTLLDNCAILATTDCGYARAHSVENYPLLIAGSAGGALRKGIHYRSVANENTSKVILSLARAVGMSLGSFGQGDGLATEGLSAIEAG